MKSILEYQTLITKRRTRFNICLRENQEREKLSHRYIGMSYGPNCMIRLSELGRTTEYVYVIFEGSTRQYTCERKIFDTLRPLPDQLL